MSESPANFLDLHPSLLHGLLAHAAERPEALLYRVIADDEQVRTASWAEFLSLSRRAASLLVAQGVGRGTRVVLMLPNSMEFLVAFFATLWCGAIAVPASRPRKASNAERLAAVLEAAAPELLVCLDGDTAMLGELFAATQVAPRLLVMSLARLAGLPEITVADRLPGGDDIALIQFTSGSTSRPKGIVISHGNLAVNIAQMNRAYAMHGGTQSLSWLPVFHDAGLVCMGVSPAIHGGSLTLSTPQRFIRRPRSWLEDISRYGITCTGAPNFAFDLATRMGGKTEGLDLSRLDTLWNGAETVHADTLRRFTQRFAACGFREQAINPAYGLAEATIGVAGGPPGNGPTIGRFDARQLAGGQAVRSDAADAIVLVSAGAPGWRTTLRIADPQTGVPRADGHIGEIWISGPQLAQGYWQQPEASAEAFVGCSADGSGPWLRSGDLGFLLDDRLYITGRIKETIIVRGRNLSPDEIELVCARAVPALPLAQIVAVPLRGASEQVGLIVELPGAQPEACTAIADAFRVAAVGSLDVSLAEILFVDAMSIPRTSSGKKQRLLAAALRDRAPERVLHVSRLAA